MVASWAQLVNRAQAKATEITLFMFDRLPFQHFKHKERACLGWRKHFDSILKSRGHREGWRTAGTFLGRSMCFVYRDTDRRNPNRDGTEAIPQITNWTGRGPASSSTQGGTGSVPSHFFVPLKSKCLSTIKNRSASAEISIGLFFSHNF
jgi:hypothetical protein